MARKSKKRKKARKKSKKKTQKKARRSAQKKGLTSKRRFLGKNYISSSGERRSERRHSPRLPICARVRWGNISENEQFFFTRDISTGGLFLLTDHPPPLQAKLSIELSIQYYREPIRLEADVYYNSVKLNIF